MTPRRIVEVIAAGRERWLDHLELQVIGAFHTEAFAREKRLSDQSLRKALPQRQEKSEQRTRSAEEEIARWDQWAGRMNRGQ